MDIDADPAGLQWDARRLGEVAADLHAAAHRLTSATGRGRGRPPGGMAEHCAALAAGIRADAAELVECAERLRGHRAGLLAAEAVAVAALRRAAERGAEAACAAPAAYERAWWEW
jgi:hypothetical protein